MCLRTRVLRRCLRVLLEKQSPVKRRAKPDKEVMNMVTIIRRNPVRALTMMEPFLHPRGILDEAERVVRDFWPRWEGGVTGTIPLDMYEHKDELVIRAELPGFKREDIDLRFEGEALTIRADKKVE